MAEPKERTTQLGLLLYAWRYEQRLTMRDLAKDIGIPVSSVHRIEHGKPLDEKNFRKVLAWMLR